MHRLVPAWVPGNVRAAQKRCPYATNTLPGVSPEIPGGPKDELLHTLPILRKRRYEKHY